MKRSGSVTALALLVTAVLCAAVFASPDSSATSGALPHVMLADLVIEPSEEHADVYECTAKVIDRRTGEILSAPRLLFPSGQDGKIRSGIEIEGRTANLDVVVHADAADRTAHVLVSLVRDGTRTTVQQLRVRL